MNPVVRFLPTSIFERMSILAREHGAINLGQGFPDFGWPDDVVRRAAEALSGDNQYPPMRGLPELREAVASHYRRHQGIDVGAEHVTVTSGATEALACAILASIEPGDEAVLFQPVYDAYAPMVRRAGGVPRFVSLTPPEWRITADALSKAITDRTRLLILNNPHNPTARMFDREELGIVADACVSHDLTALSDEVWEHVAFDGRSHIPLSALPGMAGRTVKVGSAGKIFSLTGWKVGWTVAPPRLAAILAKAHQFLTFATPPNLQSAVAYGLGKEDRWFDSMRSAFQQARDDLCGRLAEAGFATLPAQGTYFVNLDLAASGIEADDLAFCERSAREAGIAAIPVSAFYEEAEVSTVVRLCFAKRSDVIEAAVERLKQARGLFAGP